MLFTQFTLMVQLDVARDVKFRELMRITHPDAQLPDRQAELSILQTNWVTQLFFGLVSLICLFAVFSSLLD